jgi:hypothetical protein
VSADVMHTEDEHTRHQVYDVCEDGNIDRINRMLNIAYWESVSFLYSFTKQDVDDGDSTNDAIKFPDIYTIRLSVPEDFAKSSQNILEDYIHEYMTDRVLEDWMSITNKEDQITWKNKLEEIKLKISSCLSFRNKRVRIKMHPF